MLSLLLAVAQAGVPSADPVVLLTQGNGVCSGVFIDDQGTIATAYHCVMNGGDVLVETYDGREAVGRPFAQRVDHDLALLRAPELAGSAFVAIRETPLVPGEIVHTIGHPYAGSAPSGFMTGTLRFSRSSGIVSAVGDRAVQFTAPVNPGNSGGPVFDDEGLLVGIVSRRIAGDGLGFAGRVEPIAALRADPDERLNRLGGTITANAAVSFWMGDAIGTSAGATVEVAVRDRLVANALIGVPVRAWSDALRFDASESAPLSLAAGVRQRVGRGPLCVRFDVTGGIVVVQRFENTSTVTEDGGVDLRVAQTSFVRPEIGLAMNTGGVTFSMGYLPAPDGGLPGLRAVVRWGWPGHIGMF